MSDHIKIKVPFVKGFSDYHEIDDLADCINGVLQMPLLQAEEVAFHNGLYVGVFYIGTLPSRKVIKEKLEIFRKNLTSPQNVV